MTETDPAVRESRARDPQQDKPYPYYALLIALYNAIFGVFALLYRRKRQSLDSVTALDVAMLGLATMRMAKLVSEDEITEVLREPVVEVVGDDKRPAGHGLRWALGKLVLCPTCSGTWIAAFLTYALHLSPRYTRPFLAVMSASGISQTGDALLSLVYTDRDVLRKQNGQ